MENENFEDYLELSYEYDDQEQFEKALEAIQQAISLDDTSADAHNFRGILLEKLGRGEDAINAYEKAINLAPDFVDAVENLSGLKAELENKYKENSHSQRALRGAGIGAYTFGISFLVYETIRGYTISLVQDLSIPASTTITDGSTFFAIVLDPSPNLNSYLFLFLRIFACGIGFGFLNRDINKKSFWSGFLVGFIGCGISEILFRFNSPFNYLWYTYSLVGVFVGVLFGLSQRSLPLVFSLAVAGGISFGLEPTISNLSLSLVLDNGLISDQFELIILSLLSGIISGGLKGGFIGWADGKFANFNQTPDPIASQL